MTKINKLQEKVLTSFKQSIQQYKNNIHLKNLLVEIKLANDDPVYKKEFAQVVGPQIYRMHLEKYWTRCVFCRRLKKSTCHENCFICSKDIYPECCLLLPEAISFAAGFSATNTPDRSSWLFRTPCTYFEYLEEEKFFKHFSYLKQQAAIACYEVLEGLFIGISRGKRPCHLCASVCMDAYNYCLRNGESEKTSPCGQVHTTITTNLNIVHGLIRCAD